MRHIGVHSYGRKLRNQILPGPDLGPRTKLATIANYHFCLALENAVAPDYVTEKLYDCLLAGVIPVYLGAPNVAEFAPPGSYILADAYGGARGLAAYLRYLLDTPSEYSRYLAWRQKPFPVDLAAMARSVEEEPFVRLLRTASRKLNVAPRL
jgi:alpha-1,3-fucosyltransferase 10